MTRRLAPRGPAQPPGIPGTGGKTFNVALVLDGIRDAVAGLELVLERTARAEQSEELDDVLSRAVQSGVIKHFEFTYELCWRFIRRWLETNVVRDSADGVTRQELFRLGAEYRLIDSVPDWMRYHRARNLTSHTYRQATAEEVYAIIPAFLEDAKSLLAQLEARND